MADQATVFEQQAVDQQQTNVPSNDQTTSTDKSSILVGEGRKYKSFEDLERAYMNADNFIETLKEENRKLREEHTRSATIAEVLERLDANKSTTTEERQPQSADNSLTVDKVAEIVKQTVTGLDSQKTKEANLLKADRMMKEAFGEKATEVFQSKATTPQLRELYMELAATDPAQFAEAFGATRKPQSTGQVDSGSKVNTTVSYSSVNPNREADPNTREFYAKLRRENPSKYYSQEIQIQMDKAARGNPEKFFGR